MRPPYLRCVMLEELDINCSAKELKGVDHEFNDSEVLKYQPHTVCQSKMHCDLWQHASYILGKETSFGRDGFPYFLY